MCLILFQQVVLHLALKFISNIFPEFLCASIFTHLKTLKGGKVKKQTSKQITTTTKNLDNSAPFFFVSS